MGKNASQLKKKYFQNSYSGFTLLESLIALFLLSLICLLFSSAIKHTISIESHLNNQKEKEWQIFLIQLENEIKDCDYKETQTNKIVLTNKKKNYSVLIEFKLGKIVKVANGGYQPLLTEVKSATFQESNQAISINITLKNQIKKTAKWIVAKEQINGN